MKINGLSSAQLRFTLSHEKASDKDTTSDRVLQKVLFRHTNEFFIDKDSTSDTGHNSVRMSDDVELMAGDTKLWLRQIKYSIDEINIKVKGIEAEDEDS